MEVQSALIANDQSNTRREVAGFPNQKIEKLGGQEVSRQNLPVMQSKLEPIPQDKQTLMEWNDLEFFFPVTYIPDA